jgi:hypothetical protein
MECIHNGLVVVGGDLNFTMGAPKVWGPTMQVDCLLGYFIRKLEVGLFDIEPTKPTPTWRNERTREARIVKRLDRFLISEVFLWVVLAHVFPTHGFLILVKELRL